MKTLNERVADAIGVDRTVPRSLAESHGWRVQPLYEGGVLGGPEWRIDLEIQGKSVVEMVSVPGDARFLPTVNGSRDVNDRYFAHIGRVLAVKYVEVEEAILAYRRPPKDYDSDWTSAASLRKWVAEGGTRRMAAFYSRLSTAGVMRRARALGWGMDGDVAANALGAVLFATPTDWCHAVLAAAAYETRPLGWATPRKRLRRDAAGALWYGAAQVVEWTGWSIPLSSVVWRRA